MEYMIELNNVWKSFKRGERVTALRDAIPNLLNRLTGKPADHKQDIFWALKDVSFNIKKGEILGIIGPNGAGKTTILNLLAGIMKSTRGNINIKGRVSALIALGAGFHPDLTGRENIYLNGAIMGLKKREIDRKLDSIIEFAELKSFIDTPVKRYSSGMYVRLGFAVAAHIEPEILLIDEVLAVGDISFQQKCIRHISRLKEQGVAFLFVSHCMETIQEICDEVLFLAEGEVRLRGAPPEAVREYKNYAFDRSKFLEGPIPLGKGTRKGTFEAEIESVDLLNGNGEKASVFKTEEKMIIRWNYLAHNKILNPIFGIMIYTQEGVCCYGANTGFDGYAISSIEGRGIVELEIPRLDLLSGIYLLTVGIIEKNRLIFYDLHNKSYQFRVESEKEDRGIFYLPHRWKLVK